MTNRLRYSDSASDTVNDPFFIRRPPLRFRLRQTRRRPRGH
ncbi:hypothetical protein [Pararobbsia alpina]